MFEGLPAWTRRPPQEVDAMSGLYAMQRANGDWFALDDHGAFRVPVFRSSSDAMQARAFNVEMLVFSPVALKGIALKELTEENGAGAAQFWLVDEAAVNLKRGHRIEYSQLSTGEKDPGGKNGNG
jgi:hypothetical protein